MLCCCIYFINDRQINMIHVHKHLCNNWLKRIFIFKNRMPFAMFSVRFYPFLYHMLVYFSKAVTDP